MKTGPKPKTVEERFWPKVDRRSDGECWEWKAYIAPNGYGRFNRNGYAHRVSYVLSHGEIPEGLVVDHVCKNPRCVNPAHLRAVPQRVNFLEGDHPTAIATRKNECQRGHPFTPENTYVRSGHRVCRECNLSWHRSYRQKVS